MKLSTTVLVAVCMLGGCKANDATGTAHLTSGTVKAPDNTAVNAKDDNGTSITPMDQSNTPADLETTQSIRRSLMRDDTLSTDAKNIKVITANGVITLRGPVKTYAERETIVRLARGAEGANRLDDQLEVDSVR
jgi:osmotically-inducible protein OsmY